MLYFCYGSNMLTGRLRFRSPGARVCATALLPGYSLAFHKRSVDGSGKCSVVRGDGGHGVHGTLAEIPRRDVPALHRAEYLGAGYQLQHLRVFAGPRSVRARVFVAMREFVDDGLRPYLWYKTLVLRGAEQHELPREYVAGIRSVQAVRDPDGARAAANLSLL